MKDSNLDQRLLSTQANKNTSLMSTTSTSLIDSKDSYVIPGSPMQ